MALPLDPSQIEPADIGEEQATLEMSHQDAIEHVRDVFTDAGFGIPVEFSPSEMLNEKVDTDRDHYYVLGACNPKVADRELDADCADKLEDATTVPVPLHGGVLWALSPDGDGRRSRLRDRVLRTILARMGSIGDLLKPKRLM